MKARFLTIASVILLVTAACTKHAGDTPGTEANDKTQRVAPKAPDEMVEQFVKLSASAKSQEDRMRLRDMCKGKLRDAFQKMSPENFQMAYLNAAVTVEKFVIESKKIENGDALIHYKVSIQNKQGHHPTSETNEREVSLVQIDGAWYLDSIRPVGKDQIAFVNGMIF